MNLSIPVMTREWSGPVIERAAALGAKYGLAFSVSRDFDELLAINERNRQSWDPLVPQYHPGYSSALAASAFWIKGTDRTGKIVTVRAVRRIDLPAGRTLHDALTDLTFFYDDPTAASPGERVQSVALLPRAVSGSFTFGGATWTHPSARRLGMATLISPIVRAVAQDLWALPLHLAFVEHAPVMRTVVGVENIECGIRWSGSYVAPLINFSVVWWRRAQIIDVLTRFIGEG